jgi:CheY-like chemotaxis protein
LRTTKLPRQQALEAGAPASTEAESWVRVDVTDTGVGIPPDILSRLFEPFFTTKEEGRGTGMGLAAVYGAVQAHQGTVLVDSALGRGSTFSLLLPLAPPAVVTVTAAPARLPAEALNVLVVDDDPMVRAVVVRQLKQAGFSVALAAGSAIEVESYFQRDGATLDVALLDVNMPDCGGPELATRLRGLDALLPVVFMSGVEPMSTQTASLGDAFLAKPFSLGTLREALYAAANGERGSGRRRQRAASAETPAPRRATSGPQNAPHKD